MTVVLIATLVAIVFVLAFSSPVAKPPTHEGRHRLSGPKIRTLRPESARLHLADGQVDDTPLENGSPWILVRDGNRARMVSA